MTITVFLVVSEASLASCGPAHLGMEAEGTERVTGFTVGGARGGGVDRHGDVIDSDTVIVQLGGKWSAVVSYSISSYNWPQ